MSTPFGKVTLVHKVLTPLSGPAMGFYNHNALTSIVFRPSNPGYATAINVPQMYFINATKQHIKLVYF